MSKTTNYKSIAKEHNVKKALLNVLIYTALGIWALAVLFPF